MMTYVFALFTWAVAFGPAALATVAEHVVCIVSVVALK